MQSLAHMEHDDLTPGVFGAHNPKAMPAHLFFGASRIDYVTAERADVSKQNYSVCPRHWYVDATFVCVECGSEFVFSAREQRFWYEELRFWIDSLPKRCASCRQLDRVRLELRKRYDSSVSEALSSCSIEAKQQVVALISELELAEKDLPDRMLANRATLVAQIAKMG